MYRKASGVIASPGLIEVTYRPSVIANPAVTIDARIGGTNVGEFDYAKIGYATRLVRVTPADASAVESTLRATPGVVAVGESQRLSALSVNGPYLGNDPYFDGQSGVPAPLYENSAVGGQWDMHVVQLEHAFDYSQLNNGSGITNAAALGSTNVKLAIIDTGEDVTHPELAKASIVRTECFITDPNSNAQSTGTYVTDEDGHGTDVTGIAEGNANNDYGFAGDAGNVSLMLYRVFPTPDDNCTNPNSTDPQCTATDTDIASAIDDAVNNGANVISMSLGGSSCVSGADPDPVEGEAIANAIASDVIVVAAAGNSGGSGVSAPGCDPGVIAVGASAYNDGAANGTGYSGSNTEYVASYSQYGSVNTLNSSASWGIVAPGGDPTGDTDQDYLHWIENIWTTTPLDSSYAGQCDDPQFNEPGNCLTEIAGTSMATPHVAGAAALVLSVNSSYQSPTAMKELLCSTADNIYDPHQGCGRLNVYRAIATALGDPHPPT